MGYLDNLNQDHVVPATKFVRDFANYAQIAINEPVHIIKHGRQALSLVATNKLRYLLEPENHIKDTSLSNTKLDLVLDQVKTSVVLLDNDLHILRINAAARSTFQLSEDVLGVPLQKTIADPRQEFILRTVERVRNTGVAENIEFDTFDRPTRTFQAYITTFPGGLAVFTEDVTSTSALRDADAVADAYAGLMEITPGLASGMLNIRGIITLASQSLSDLVKSERERLVGVRLTALCGASFRGEVTDRLETLLTAAQPFSMRVDLIGSEGKAIPATLSAYPHLNAGRKPGATFLVQSSA